MSDATRAAHKCPACGHLFECAAFKSEATTREPELSEAKRRELSLESRGAEYDMTKGYRPKETPRHD